MRQVDSAATEMILLLHNTWADAFLINLLSPDGEILSLKLWIGLN